MRRYSWFGKAAVSALCVATGCTAVPINQPSAQRQTERPSKTTVAEKSLKSAKLAKTDSLTSTDELPSRRNAEVLHSQQIPQMDPPVDREIVARKVALSPSLSGTPASGMRPLEPDGDAPVIRLTKSDEADPHRGEVDLVEPAAHSEAPQRLQQMAETDSAPSEEAPSAVVPPGPMIAENANGGEPGTSEAAIKPELPVGYELSLGNVLYLADAQNPNVAFARERINEAYARVDRAEALWLPSIRAGINYIHHEGNVQDVAGNIIETNKSSLYGGLGAAAAGGGNPALPGVVAQFHLTDAIFQPKIAGHQASSRQFGAAAVRNDTLRNTAVAYLELLRAEQSLAISEEALTNTTRLVKLTGEYDRTGQGLRSDYERMLAEQAIRESDIFTRIEGVRVTSARLAQLLHSDPSVRISSGEPMVVPLDMVDKSSTSASFVSTGLMRRPELAEQKHLVGEAVERLNREKFAPLVPSVLLGFSYGGMGGGHGSSIINTDDRWDADALAYWEVRNFGIGERAARNEMSSVIRQVQHRQLAVMDQVAREVVEAHAQLIERERRIVAARNGITAAERSFRLNEERIENAQGLPIESLQSVQALAAARLSYLNAVIDYNIAQFELCRAIGWFEGETMTP